MQDRLLLQDADAAILLTWARERHRFQLSAVELVKQSHQIISGRAQKDFGSLGLRFLDPLLRKECLSCRNQARHNKTHGEIGSVLGVGQDGLDHLGGTGAQRSSDLDVDAFAKGQL